MKAAALPARSERMATDFIVFECLFRQSWITSYCFVIFVRLIKGNDAFVWTVSQSSFTVSRCQHVHIEDAPLQTSVKQID